jgi:hypothetical protein
MSAVPLNCGASGLEALENDSLEWTAKRSRPHGVWSPESRVFGVGDVG